MGEVRRILLLTYGLTRRRKAFREEAMAEDRNELLQHYAQMREDLLAAIEGLSDEQLSENTLDGWSVSDHLMHLAAWDEIRASEVARISAGHDSAWRMSGEQDATYSTLAHDLRHALAPAQAKWELEVSRKRLVEAITAATARGLDGSLYGEAGLRSTHEAQHTGWIKRWRGERSY
jgi:uncharacterized damage-inducible protein DinB